MDCPPLADSAGYNVMGPVDQMTPIIGLTGGIGSGKSTVANLFKKLGASILDADVAARRVVEPGSSGLRDLTEALGEDIVKDDGELDRTRLRQQIFSNPAQREVVEEILHPRIFDMLQKEIAETTAPYIILVVPLLLESDREYPVGRILVVDLPESEQIRRVMARDHMTQPEVEKIIAAQASREERLNRADDVISNIDAASVPEQVERLHESYLQLPKSPDRNVG